MLISYSHRFLFFHVAKAAGTSLKEALKPYAQNVEKFKIKRPPKMSEGQPNPLYKMWESSLWHAKARDVKQEFPEDIYNNFYKFAFVRNPWDWQISYYHFILKETSHIRHQLVRSLGSFESYLEWVIQTQNPFPKGATKLQKDIVTDSEGRLIVDFVGRYEALAQDFEHICQVLNLQVTLPHLNHSKHQDYQTFYCTRTRNLVEQHFKPDIELFGYTFDGYPSRPILSSPQIIHPLY